MELYLHKDEIDILAEKISSLKKLFNLVNKLKEQDITFNSNGIICIHLEDKKMISNEKDTSKYPIPLTIDMVPNEKDTVKSNPYDWHKNPNALVNLFLLSAPNEMKPYIVNAVANNTGTSRRKSINIIYKKIPIELLVTSTLKNALHLAYEIEQHQGCKCGITFRPEEDQSMKVLEGTTESIQINEPILKSYKGFKVLTNQFKI